MCIDINGIKFKRGFLGRKGAEGGLYEEKSPADSSVHS